MVGMVGGYGRCGGYGGSNLAGDHQCGGYLPTVWGQGAGGCLIAIAGCACACPAA